MRLLIDFDLDFVYTAEYLARKALAHGHRMWALAPADNILYPLPPNPHNPSFSLISTSKQLIRSVVVP